jgi:hypothetical protein
VPGFGKKHLLLLLLPGQFTVDLGMQHHPARPSLGRRRPRIVCALTDR